MCPDVVLLYPERNSTHPIECFLKINTIRVHVIPVGPDRVERRLEKELVFEINRRKLVSIGIMEARRFRLKQ